MINIVPILTKAISGTAASGQEAINSMKANTIKAGDSLEVRATKDARMRDTISNIAKQYGLELPPMPLTMNEKKYQAQEKKAIAAELKRRG